jgi:hypothetical protein
MHGLGTPPSYFAQREPAPASQLPGNPAQDNPGGAPSVVDQGRLPPAPISLWGAPDHTDEPVTVKEPVVAPPEPPEPHEPHEMSEPPAPPGPPEPQEEDPDKVDTAPTRLATPVERDPLTDTGRHARIGIQEPDPSATALHLPLDDPGRAPEGYPVKANTRSGLYWAPGGAHYDDAQAEIWFASEEFAITNGFVNGDRNSVGTGSG